MAVLLVALSGLLVGGAVALRQQGRPWWVVGLTGVLAAMFLWLAVQEGAFG